MKNALLDVAMIIGGAGLSTAFISTDGNGQNPLPVAANMLLVVAVVGAVSFSLSWFVRTVPLAIGGSICITELLFLVFFVYRVAFSTHLHEHVSEELYLLPIVFAVVTAPTVLLSSIGFGRLVSRFHRRQRAEPSSAGDVAKSAASEK